MPYIDAAYYKSVIGEDAPADFTILEDAVHTLLEGRTLGKIGDDLSVFPEYVRDKIKKATAYQVKALSDQGGISSIITNSGSVASASIGKFSYTETAQSNQFLTGLSLLPLVELLLAQVGLLSMRADVCE